MYGIVFTVLILSASSLHSKLYAVLDTRIGYLYDTQDSFCNDAIDSGRDIKSYRSSVFILLDYPIHIVGLQQASILYFKGLLVKLLIKLCISVPEGCSI